MTIAMGIDGGGTQTRCLVIDEHGAILGSGSSGPSKPDAIDPETGTANLQMAIKLACTSGVEQVDSLFIGMGGVVSEADVQVVRGMLSGLALHPDVKIGIDHDIRIALAGATAGQPGIALIVGTGSSCYGRNAAGESWRCGGWGFAIDDMGSSYYLGQQALAAIVQGVDGRGPATALKEPIFTALGITDPNEIMHRIYHPRLDLTGIAALAPIVVRAAERDPVAQAIIERGCAALAELVRVTAERLQLPADVLVVPVGGLGTLSAMYRAGLDRAIQSALPQARIRDPLVPAVAGAAFLALEQVGITLSESALMQLRTVG